MGPGHVLRSPSVRSEVFKLALTKIARVPDRQAGAGGEPRSPTASSIISDQRTDKLIPENHRGPH
jgi:hypothetical protein